MKGALLILSLLAACAPRTTVLEIDALDHRVRRFVRQHQQAPYRRVVQLPGARLQLQCPTGQRCDDQRRQLTWATSAPGTHLQIQGPGAWLRPEFVEVLELHGGRLALPLKLETPGWMLAASGQNLKATVESSNGPLITVMLTGQLHRLVATRTTPECVEASAPSADCERRYATAFKVQFVWTGRLDHTPLDCRVWPAPAGCK